MVSIKVKSSFENSLMLVAYHTLWRFHNENGSVIIIIPLGLRSSIRSLGSPRSIISIKKTNNKSNMTKQLLKNWSWLPTHSSYSYDIKGFRKRSSNTQERKSTFAMVKVKFVFIKWKSVPKGGWVSFPYEKVRKFSPYKLKKPHNSFIHLLFTSYHRAHLPKKAKNLFS